MFNGKTVDSPSILRNTVAQTPVGKTIKVELLREKKTRSVEVKSTEQRKDVAQAEEERAQGDDKNTALAGVEVRNLTAEIARQLGLPAGTVGGVIARVDGGSAARGAGLQG